ncbi:MAG: hypothetical protein JSS82_15780 [Bacteroidetes bacterium]|nr:hypothetical protein [Bacteroidota bacterium]
MVHSEKPGKFKGKRQMDKDEVLRLVNALNRRAEYFYSLAKFMNRNIESMIQFGNGNICKDEADCASITSVLCKLDEGIIKPDLDGPSKFVERYSMGNTSFGETVFLPTQ